MAMNKRLQVMKIRAAIEKKGYASDLIDVNALVDSTLTLGENWNSIKSDLDYMGLPKKRKSNAGIRTAKYMQKALLINSKRSPRSQMQDSKKQAVTTFESLTKKKFSKWKKNPGRYDIMGVDSKY